MSTPSGTKAKYLKKLREGLDKSAAFLESGASVEDLKQWERDTDTQLEVEQILLENEYLLDSKIAALGKRKLLEVFQNGVQITKTKTTYVRRYGEDDATGELVSATTTREIIEMPIPDWMFRYAESIDKKRSVENAIRLLASEMLLPVETVKRLLAWQQSQREDLRHVMSGDTVEASSSEADVALAQAELLGIPPERLVTRLL